MRSGAMINKFGYTLLDKLAAKIDKKGGPPHDGGMETRVAKLENFVIDARERLARMEVRLEQTATITDIHRETSAQTWRLVTFVCSFGTALVAASYFLAKHVS